MCTTEISNINCDILKELVHEIKSMMSSSSPYEFMDDLLNSYSEKRTFIKSAPMIWGYNYSKETKFCKLYVVVDPDKFNIISLEIKSNE